MNRMVITLAVLSMVATVAFFAADTLAADTFATDNGELDDSALMRALRDELARSMEELRLPDADGPYFLAYRVDETARHTATASLGGLLDSHTERRRRLVVELRVGTYEFDNTNFLSGPNPTTVLSVDDDYHALRRQIWIATDAAYKRALDQLAGKRAALQNRTRVEDVADFTREEVHRFDGWTGTGLDTARLPGLAIDASGALRDMPHLSRSKVRVAAALDRIWFVSSEGSAFVRETPSIGIQVRAVSHAADGAELQDAVFVRAERWQEVPDLAVLTADIRAMADRLAARRTARVADRYAGPVLFEGQAAAELITQVIGPRLTAVRLPAAADPRIEQAIARFRNPLLDKLGSRVLPRSLSVVSDPTADANRGVPLLGRRVIDDDGVPGRRLVLVERGMLRNLLATRVPLAEVSRSSGSRRRDGPAPTNLFIESTGGSTSDELREELFALAEERGLGHALVVRRIDTRLAGLGLTAPRLPGSDSISVEPLIGVYRVYPDGSEERVRTATLSALSVSDFRDIVAVSDSTTRHETGFSPMPTIQGGGSVRPITVVTPALLFEDITVRRPPGAIRRPPLLPHPLAGSPDSRQG